MRDLSPSNNTHKYNKKTKKERNKKEDKIKHST